MNTIVLSLEEAARDLAAVIHQLRACGGRVVLTSGDQPIVEITPVIRPPVEGADRKYSADTEITGGKPRDRIGPRVVYSELTGLPVVTARPGDRMVTSEEIYAELRGSFP